MNTLVARDKLFSELHSSTLKIAGFKKRGHWSMRAQGETIQTVYLRASRFGDKDHAIFWVDVQVFHAGWYELIFKPKEFPGPKEGVPSLLTEELGDLCDPPIHTFEIWSHTSIEELSNAACRAVVCHALPLLDRCTTLEGVLAYYEGRQNPKADALSAAGVCLLLGRQAEARTKMDEAMRCAPHENARRWLQLREKAMWSNPSLHRMASPPAEL